MNIMWQFKTAQFKVIWHITESLYPDLSFDETGEIRDKINSGEYQVFDSVIEVILGGVCIGESHLGESIYANPAEFRDHIGINEIASKAKANRKLAKASREFSKRSIYCLEKLQSGQWSRRFYMLSMADYRQAARDARKVYQHEMQIAGKCGSYFSDLVREAIQNARDNLADMPKIRKAG